MDKQNVTEHCSNA